MSAPSRGSCIVTPPATFVKASGPRFTLSTRSTANGTWTVSERRGAGSPRQFSSVTAAPSAEVRIGASTIGVSTVVGGFTPASCTG